MCLASAGEGKTYRLHVALPDASLNKRIAQPRAEGAPVSPYAIPQPVAEPVGALIRVDISGPIEQRAQWVECEGYVDGHDAIAERLCAAFAEGDVLLVCDTPGGAASGIQQNVARALAAKEAHGRRCTGAVDEQMGSAGTWWMLGICDEIFGVSPASTLGSVGARGGHMSIAGMLAKDGVVMTYFADPPEKVALAPELPLSEEGARRGNRDVSITADAFRAAVCESPIGKRFGLTPEGLIALGADMLTGEAAVGVFCDGIETMENVTAYALALAESSSAKEIETEARAAASASATKIRATAHAPRRAA